MCYNSDSVVLHKSTCRGMGRGKEGDVIASKMLKDSLKTAWLTQYLDLAGYLGKKKS